jgi:hypothetical protein
MRLDARKRVAPEGRASACPGSITAVSLLRIRCTGRAPSLNAVLRRYQGDARLFNWMVWEVVNVPSPLPSKMERVPSVRWNRRGQGDRPCRNQPSGGASFLPDGRALSLNTCRRRLRGRSAPCADGWGILRARHGRQRKAIDVAILVKVPMEISPLDAAQPEVNDLLLGKVARPTPR